MNKNKYTYQRLSYRSVQRDDVHCRVCAQEASTQDGDDGKRS